MIDVECLTVNYKDFCAVNEVSLHINQNEIFGIIGLNGAGKTTMVECMEGLKKPSSGKIHICGYDPLKDRKKIHELVGIQLQDTSYQNNAKVYELCELFSSFYDHPVPYEELLKMMGILDKRKVFFSKLSGGQKQKLSIVLALIGNPKVIFLDELTTGLDPNARHQMWELLLDLKRKGITIVLVSHFMDEVEALCDRIAIMNRGKILAIGSLDEIMEKYQLSERISFKAVDRKIDNLCKMDCVTKVEEEDGKVVVYGKDNNFISLVVNFLDKNNIHYSNFDVKKPNLEDVFLSLSKEESSSGEGM